MQALSIGGDDAGGFLSAVLQGVQAEVGELLGFGVAVDRHHAAFFTKFVGRQHLAPSL